MATLLFVTGAYPYYPGEQFIETEIHFLADVFEKIFVLPLDGDISQPRRPLPANVILLDEVRSFREKYRRNFFSRTIGIYKAFAAFSKEIRLRNLFFIKYPKALNSLLRMISSAGQFSPLITRVISENQPDLIYSYWLSTGALSAVIALDKTSSRIPLVSRVHGFDLYEERHNPPYCPLQAFLLTKLKTIFPIALDGEAYLSVKYPKPIFNKLKTSHLGVVSNRVSKMSPDKILRIVSCSSLVPIKRVNLLIEALALLDFPIHWTHIGDGPLRSTLENQANTLKAKRTNVKITFLGQIPNQEVLNFYDSNPVDVFVNVSSSEGIPVSIMEAMSRGIPTIATAVGGTSEIVNEAVGTGFLLPENVTPRDVAKRIDYFYYLPQSEKEKMRQKAYFIWFNDFNAEKNYSDFARFLARLASGDE